MERPLGPQDAVTRHAGAARTAASTRQPSAGNRAVDAAGPDRPARPPTPERRHPHRPALARPARRFGAAGRRAMFAGGAQESAARRRRPAPSRTASREDGDGRGDTGPAPSPHYGPEQRVVADRKDAGGGGSQDDRAGGSGSRAEDPPPRGGPASRAPAGPGRMAKDRRCPSGRNRRADRRAANHSSHRNGPGVNTARTAPLPSASDGGSFQRVPFPSLPNAI